MAQEDLDALLQRMESIATAVNSFTSEAVQQEAFAALVAAFEGRRHAPRNAAAAAPVEAPEHELDVAKADAAPDKAAGSKASNGTAKHKRSAKDTRGEWKLVKDLDLRPAGKQSFEDFIEEKRPASNEDKYVAVIYYLSEVLEVQNVSIHHVGTVFRLTKTWKEPTDVASGLRTASARKATLDAKILDSIKLTATGRNFIDHDLPPKEKAKK
ncbi:hypothetical protein [Phenylobacterium sp.]|uniref:hypothetical protein n=1 Tax=Phenylobacterium sp. TaxID=1871053 RepID=UPI00272FD729|nr:hypothetical protein [Phenylobacterium sp.]MDP1598690.1 hypothetical protein [Phenylobacterium sp.]MDP3594204.1 hypothetical protein [Phenylobacterium sp.]